MPRRSTAGEPERIRRALATLIDNFASELTRPNLRAKVQALIPAFHKLRELGASLIPSNDPEAARDRLLKYLRRYPRTIIRGDELMVVSGIGEWARRIRELRVQFGWRILTGVTLQQMAAEEEFRPIDLDIGQLGVDDYFLASDKEDRDAAHRWNVANAIRRKSTSVKNKILEFLRANVGQAVTGEELRYVASGRTEWARRVRELRTEEGWPVVTRNTGRADLSVGTYVLEKDRQLPAHDRHISDAVRIVVLKRDGYKCVTCGWKRSDWSPDDPRNLELHHRVHHVRGGENTPENLETLCNVCHDSRHKAERVRR